jgi:dihydrofolate reductase
VGGNVLLEEFKGATPCRPLLVGGARFDQALTRLGLVDEYRLMVQPAALGAGLPLFKDLSAPLQLELVEATTYATGLVIHIYRPRQP